MLTLNTGVTLHIVDFSTPSYLLFAPMGGDEVYLERYSGCLERGTMRLGQVSYGDSANRSLVFPTLHSSCRDFFRGIWNSSTPPHFANCSRSANTPDPANKSREDVGRFFGGGLVGVTMEGGNRGIPVK